MTLITITDAARAVGVCRCTVERRIEKYDVPIHNGSLNADKGVYLKTIDTKYLGIIRDNPKPIKKRRKQDKHEHYANKFDKKKPPSRNREFGYYHKITDGCYLEDRR